MFSEQNPHQTYDKLLENLRSVFFLVLPQPASPPLWRAVQTSESMQTHPHTRIRAESTTFRVASCGTLVLFWRVFSCLNADFLTCDRALVCRISIGNLLYKQCCGNRWEIGRSLEYLVLISIDTSFIKRTYFHSWLELPKFCVPWGERASALSSLS